MKFDPLPPLTPPLASEADIAALEALVRKLGWEETMYHLGVLIRKHAEEATGPNKGALEVAADIVCLWGPSFHFCGEGTCPTTTEERGRRCSPSSS